MARVAPAPKQQAQYALTNRRRHSLQALQLESSEPLSPSPRRGRRWSAAAYAGSNIAAHKRFFTSPSEPLSPRKVLAAVDMDEQMSTPRAQLPLKRASTVHMEPETQSRSSTQNELPNPVSKQPIEDEQDLVDEAVKTAIKTAADKLGDAFKINGAMKGRGSLDISGAVDENSQTRTADEALQRMSDWEWMPAGPEDAGSSKIEKLEARTKGLEQSLQHVQKLSRKLDANEAGDATMSGSSIYNSVGKRVEKKEIEKEPGSIAKHKEEVPVTPDDTKLPITRRADMNKADLPACIFKAAPSLAKQADSSPTNEAGLAAEATSPLVRRRSADMRLSPIKVNVGENRRRSMPGVLEPTSPKTAKSLPTSPKSRASQLRRAETNSFGG